MRYGIGDIFDSEEYQNDVTGEFYFIEYGSTSESGKYTAMSGAQPSLKSAVTHAEESIDSVIDWET